MATDFNSLWRREVEKLNRQIHKYEKEGVRFRVSAIEETEPKKKYTQADLDLVKAKRLTLFEGAEMFDQETWKTYRGKEEITNRIRQRKAQEDLIKRYANIQSDIQNDINAKKDNNYNENDINAKKDNNYNENDINIKKDKVNKERGNKILTEARRTEKVADLSGSIYNRFMELLDNYDAYSMWSGSLADDKNQQAQTILAEIRSYLLRWSEVEVAAALEQHPDLISKLETVLYDSDVIRTDSEFGAILYLLEDALQGPNMAELDAFMEKYNITEEYFELYEDGLI